MGLSNYILNNIDAILHKWDGFAFILMPLEQQGQGSSHSYLTKLLVALAADLDRYHKMPGKAYPSERAVKHKDSASSARNASFQDRDALFQGGGAWVQSHEAGAIKQTIAFIHEQHGSMSLNRLLAEYRTLRASVACLWRQSFTENPLPVIALEELIRFNDAMDYLMGETVSVHVSEQEQRNRALSAILSSSRDLSFTFDLQGKFSYLNKAFVELLQRPLDQIIDSSCLDLPSPHAAEFNRHLQWVANNKKQLHGELPFMDATGKVDFYAYTLAPVLDQTGVVAEAIAGTARNISERKSTEDESWQKVNYDLLTGLPNQRLFLDRLLQDIKYAERGNSQLALLFIDLDRFKEANDNFGQDAGDLLLRRVADRLRALVRATDTVARLGGDEFVVILQNVGDVDHIRCITDKILRGLATPFEIYTHHIDISSSIGVAIFPQDASMPNDLIKHADQAMYTAKTAGRNRMSFFLPN